MVGEIQFSWNWGAVRHVPDIVFAAGLVDDFAFESDESGESGDGEVVVAVGHDAYAHMAVMPGRVRRALARDFG